VHYIFGYGSLICKDSRSRTGISSTAHPIEVKGIKRKWSVHTPDWPATAVSAHIDEQALCNGVYFKVDEANLKKFDQREQGYKRIQLNWQDIQTLTNNPLPTHGSLWAYIGFHKNEPSIDKPIMQSYLDVILNGCLDHGDNFAHRFTELTGQWKHLVNDRHQPTYPRPLKSQDRLNHIDQIIRKQLPELWHRKMHHK